MFRLMLDWDLGEGADDVPRSCAGRRSAAWHRERAGDGPGPRWGAGTDLTTRTHLHNSGPGRRRGDRGRFVGPGFPPVLWRRLSALVGEGRAALRPLGLDRSGDVQ